MKKTIIIIVLVALYLSSAAQINKYGIPLISNYTADEYMSEPQNWAVVTDNRGVVYIGNNNGILEYDGVSWRTINIPNNSIIRSLAVDSNGLVFVGAYDEFGYLSPDETGLMQYHSLVHLVDTLFLNFEDVWKIYVKPEAVYFGTIEYLFKYDYKTITVIGNSYDKKANLFFFMPDENIFLGNVLEGLLKLKSQVYSTFLNSNYFINKYILGINKIDDENYLISTYMNGLYTFNFETGIDTLQNSIPPETNQILSNAIILNVSKINNNSYLFSTNNNGIIATNNKFEITSIIGRNQKLQDNLAYATGNNFGKKTPVWCALDNGISKVELNSPFRYFDKSFGYEGNIFDIIEFNNQIYFATNIGVYLLAFDSKNMPFFQKIELLPDKPSIEAWNFTKIIENNEEKLLVGTNFGVFYLNKLNTTQLLIEKDISKSSWAVISLKNSVLNNNTLYIGTAKSFYILKKDVNSWKVDTTIILEKEIRAICEDNDGNIWLGTHYSGVIKLDKNYKITEYGIEKGLPVLKDPIINIYNNDIVIATPEGLYTFSTEKDSIILYEKFGEELNSKSLGFYKSANNEQSIWYATFQNKYETIKQINIGDSPKIISIPFKRIDFKGIRNLFYDSNGILWIGTPDAIYTYDTKYKKNYNIEFNTLIRKVYLKNDSVLFNGTFYSNYGKDTVLYPSVTQSKNLINQLKFAENTIIFEWAATFYEDESSNEFSYLLDGFDKNWSKWSNETKYVFTNLPEGTYTFKVKSRNKYGKEGSEASYKFVILPPWYRTFVAYLFYIILTLITVFFVVKWYTRKLKRENIRLEKIVDERTKEIQLKNAELLQSNEEIEAQRDEIEAQRDVVLLKNQEIEEKNESINASIQYASRIQRAILPPINPLDANFAENFILYMPRDIVSGDFYWLRQQDNKVYVVAADCTGHGVPGAFMSMLGISLLNEIVDKNSGIEAFDVLNKLRNNVIKSLHQREEHTTSQDGMDLSLIVFDKLTNEVSFSAANNPLVLVREKSINIQSAIEGLGPKGYKIMESEDANLVEIRADKMPIGIYVKDNVSFSQHKFIAQKGDTMYIFSDGFPDQFGGTKNQKFMIKRLKQIFLDINKNPLSEQKLILKTKFNEWVNHIQPNSNKIYNQTDDVIILSVKV